MQWVDTHHRPALRQWAEQLKIANWRFARSSTLRVLFDARQVQAQPAGQQCCLALGGLAQHHVHRLGSLGGPLAAALQWAARLCE